MANMKIFAVSFTSEIYVDSGRPGMLYAFIHRYNPKEGPDTRTCRPYDRMGPRSIARIRALQDALQKRAKESK